MSEFRATLAIVRRHFDRRFALDWVIQFVIVGVLAYLFSPVFPQAVFAIAITSCLAAVSAGERGQAASLRRLTFFAMPLYGRQLARAHAVAPAALALTVPLGYAAGAALRGRALPYDVFFSIVLGALVSTLVSLSSTFRDGLRAWLYVVLAAVVGTAIGVIPQQLGTPHVFLIALAISLVAGFFALRAFGETLARYDPI